MYKIKIFALLGAILMVMGCGSNKLDYYSDTTPAADIREYFQGPIKAWGIVQDWRGRVTRRFDVDMMATWQGDVGTLQEKFSYYDGEIQERVWTITKQPNGRYAGTAHDILDVAKGQSNGSATQWSYVMDLPVGDTTYRITFDDWMFMMNDGILINRSYLKKFGFTVAELSIFMQKQEK